MTNNWSRRSPRVFWHIDKARWSLVAFLFFIIFCHKDADGKNISCTHSHAAAVQKFLTGKTDYSPTDIPASCFHSQDGHLDETDNSTLMYSMTIPYKNIKPVQASLTSFAVQTIKEQLVQEAMNAVKQSRGFMWLSPTNLPCDPRLCRFPNGLVWHDWHVVQ